jgi:hypothetical protein
MVERQEIIVRRPVWELAQEVEQNIDKIRGSFTRTFADRDWQSTYAMRQAEVYEQAGQVSLAELWRAVERYFLEMEAADTGATVRVIGD